MSKFNCLRLNKCTNSHSNPKKSDAVQRSSQSKHVPVLDISAVFGCILFPQKKRGIVKTYNA